MLRLGDAIRARHRLLQRHVWPAQQSCYGLDALGERSTGEWGVCVDDLIGIHRGSFPLLSKPHRLDFSTVEGFYASVNNFLRRNDAFLSVPLRQVLFVQA